MNLLRLAAAVCLLALLWQFPGITRAQDCNGPTCPNCRSVDPDLLSIATAVAKLSETEKPPLAPRLKIPLLRAVAHRAAEAARVAAVITHNRPVATRVACVVEARPVARFVRQCRTRCRCH